MAGLRSGNCAPGLLFLPKVKEGIDWLYANVKEVYADAVTFGNAEKLLGCTM